MAPHVPQGPQFDVPWYYCAMSNVHVVNDPDWFTTLAPFQTELYTNDCEYSVLGVGSVELKVVTQDSNGADQDHILILRDVLYVEKFQCNIIGGQIPAKSNLDGHKDYRPICLQLILQATNGESAHPIGRDHHRIRMLELCHQPRGRLWRCRSEHVSWHDEFRQHWAEFQSGEDSCMPEEEREWISARYGSLSKFCKLRGLDDTRESDGIEARRLMRVLMENGVEDTDDDDDDNADEDSNSDI